MKLFNALSIFLAVFQFFGGSTMAASSPPPEYIFSEKMDFWKLIDLTINVDNTSVLNFEIGDAPPESLSVISPVDEFHHSTAAEVKFDFFSKSNNSTDKINTFGNGGGDWKISDFYDYMITANSPWYPPLNSRYEYHFSINDPPPASLDYAVYRIQKSNSRDFLGEQLLKVYNPGEPDVYIYIEDLLAKNSDWNWEDMNVVVSDILSFHIPGTAVMLLFGTGLAGLAALTRRRFYINKQA